MGDEASRNQWKPDELHEEGFSKVVVVPVSGVEAQVENAEVPGEKQPPCVGVQAVGGGSIPQDLAVCWTHA